MLTLPQKTLNYLRRAHVRLTALIGMVQSFLNDEQSSQADWDACEQQGIPGTDFPATTFNGALNATAVTVTVVTTDGFTVGSVANPGHLIFDDGVNREIVSYTGSTATTFTGLVRGLYSTTAQSWSVGENIWQLEFSHGSAIDYNLEIQPKNWVQPVASGGPPVPRRDFIICYRTVDGCFYLFGGYDGAVYLNDTWKFDPSTDTWTLIVPGASPPIRSMHAMVYSVVDDELWMCGGYNGATILQDLWKYDFTANNWTTNGAWTMPGRRRQPIACYYEDTPGLSNMLLTGGIHVLTTDDNNTWRFRPSGWTTGLKNAPYLWCQGDACWMEKEGIILAIGDSAVAAYDYTVDQWDSSPAMPATRWNPTLVYDDVNNVALLFGGAVINNVVAEKNLYSYSRATNSWTTLDEYSREGRDRHGAAWNSDDKYMLTWGGVIDNSPITFPTFIDPIIFQHYWPSVEVRTQNLDMGEVPAFNGEMRLEDIFDDVNGITGIVYDPDYSDDAAAWTNLGVSKDGDEVSELHQYWRFDVTFTNNGLNLTPAVTLIDVVYDQIGYVAMANHPVDSFHQYPPLIKKISIGPSKIDILRNSANIGTASFDIISDTRLERAIKEFYPRNNTLYIQIGFAEKDFTFPEYVLAFKSRIEDWNFDGKILNAKTMDFLGDLDADIPVEDATGTIVPIVYTGTAGGISNPVDILLDIIRNHINIPDRDLDLASFDDVKADASIATWEFKRTLDDPENARKLCLEICRLIGAVLIPREDGKLALKLLDPTAEPVTTWDERNQSFKNVKFMARAQDSIRNYISTWFGWDGKGEEPSNWSDAQVSINAPSITNWGRKVFRTKSKWIGDHIPDYNGDVVAAAVSDRILALAKNGIPRITLETNMSAFPVQVGDLVRIRSSVVMANDEYLEWQRKYDPVRELIFFDTSGRYTIPYLVFGTGECIDMKWFVTRKQLDIGKGTIKWEMSRAREIPLTQQFTSQDDFANGFGNYIDLESTPGSVEIDLIEIFQTIESCETGGTLIRLGDTSVDTLDAVNFVEGSNSWDLGKPNGTNTFAIYYKASDAVFDGENVFYYVWVYITAAALALLKSTGTALRMLAAEGIGITDFYVRDYTQAELTAGLSGGRIKLGGKMPDDFTIAGSPDINNLDAIYLRFNTDLAADVIPHTELGADWWHIYLGPAIYELIIDMTQQPEQPGVWTIDKTEPAGTSITIEAWASETGFFKGEEISLGTIVDTNAITIKTRFYKIKATMTPDDLYATTPSINEITATFANG